MRVDLWNLRRDGERGAAAVEFVLVCLVLLPLVTAILQLAIFLHVRNTARACAHEGARVGANHNRTASQGAEAANTCLREALPNSAKSAQAVKETPTVVIELVYTQPAFGIWGSAATVKAIGHARKEPKV